MTGNRKLNYLIGAAALPSVLFFALWLPPAPLAAGTNLDEKARYEKVLEQKLEDLLTSLLGPGKAKVMVQATIDFSATENFSAMSGEGAPGQAAVPAADAGNTNAWWSDIMSKLQPNNAGGEGETRARKAIVFPPVMLKRLEVSLVLSDTISEQEVQKIRAVTSDMLGIDPARGDKLQIMKAKFAPVWQTPEMFSMLVKYGVLAAILIVAMGIAAVGFLKMAGAMSSMGGAGQQKISMEMNAGGPADGAAMDFALPETGSRPHGTVPGAERGQLEALPSDGVTFNVPPGKLGILVSMLALQEPADIALIAVHLPVGLRSQFIAKFPPEKVSHICASIATVRFVDPEMIAKIKEELERRLSGAVGGDDKLLEVMGSADAKTKKALYENLKMNHPEVAARMRSSIIFIEDLEKLPDNDLSILVGTVSAAQWALAAWEMPEAARERLRGQMVKRSWQMVEQTLKGPRPPEDKIAEARESVIASVWDLVLTGRIKNPNASALPSTDGVEITGAPSPGTPAAAAAGHGARPKEKEAAIHVRQLNGFYKD